MTPWSVTTALLCTILYFCLCFWLYFCLYFCLYSLLYFYLYFLAFQYKFLPVCISVCSQQTNIQDTPPLLVCHHCTGKHEKLPQAAKVPCIFSGNGNGNSIGKGWTKIVKLKENLSDRIILIICLLVKSGPAMQTQGDTSNVIFNNLPCISEGLKLNF